MTAGRRIAEALRRAVAAAEVVRADNTALRLALGSALQAAADGAEAGAACGSAAREALGLLRTGNLGALAQVAAIPSITTTAGAAAAGGKQQQQQQGQEAEDGGEAQQPLAPTPLPLAGAVVRGELPEQRTALLAVQNGLLERALLAEDHVVDLLRAFHDDVGPQAAAEVPPAAPAGGGEGEGEGRAWGRGRSWRRLGFRF